MLGGESLRKAKIKSLLTGSPDLTPAALTAATVLPVYDEAWERLRIEYLEASRYIPQRLMIKADVFQLYEDARKRYASISVKQAELKELEESVADGVIELDQVSSSHLLRRIFTDF